MIEGSASPWTSGDSDIGNVLALFTLAGRVIREGIYMNVDISRIDHMLYISLCPAIDLHYIGA